MERARWSVEIEGDDVLDLRVHPETGHILIATTVQGPTTISKGPAIVIHHVGSPIPRGSVLITKDGLLAAHRPPDGAWRFTDHADPGEATPSIRALSDLRRPIEQARAGALRIGLVDFELVGCTLSRFASDGTLVSTLELPINAWSAAMHRAWPAAVGLAERFFRMQGPCAWA